MLPLIPMRPTKYMTTKTTAISGGGGPAEVAGGELIMCIKSAVGFISSAIKNKNSDRKNCGNN